MMNQSSANDEYSHDQFNIKLVELLEYVDSAKNKGLHAHDVELGVFRKVLEIGRLAFGSFLEQCGDGDMGIEAVLPDGNIVRRLKDLHKRKYLSVFGGFDLFRAVYGTREKQKIQFVPLDAQLSLPEAKFSYLLQDWDQGLAVDQPFARVNETIERILGFTQSVHSLERGNQEMSKSVSAFCEQVSYPPAEEEGEFVVIQNDGKGVVMCEEVDNKRKEEISNPFSEESKNEKTGKKKMALVSATYTIAPYIRTPTDVLNALFREEVKNDSARPRPIGKNVRASLLRDEKDTMRPSYNEIFEAQTKQIKLRNPTGDKTVVCIMDGQESLWLAVEKYMTDMNVVKILDIIHVTSYVWDAAAIFYGSGTPKACQFAKKQIGRILEGEVAVVIRGLRWKGTAAKLTDKKAEKLSTICGYLENNRKRMDYNEYLKLGYPIASGVIEGACRNIIVDRMEHSGMRWTLKGAHAMLGMRCIKLSDTWDEFTRFRIEREHHRLYPSNKYNNGNASKVA